MRKGPERRWGAPALLSCPYSRVAAKRSSRKPSFRCCEFLDTGKDMKAIKEPGAISPRLSNLVSVKVCRCYSAGGMNGFGHTCTLNGFLPLLVVSNPSCSLFEPQLPAAPGGALAAIAGMALIATIRAITATIPSNIRMRLIRYLPFPATPSRSQRAVG